MERTSNSSPEAPDPLGSGYGAPGRSLRPRGDSTPNGSEVFAGQI
jgi:hypothetical protein